MAAGTGASGLPRLNLYPSAVGRGEGDKPAGEQPGAPPSAGPQVGGEIRALREQRAAGGTEGDAESAAAPGADPAAPKAVAAQAARPPEAPPAPQPGPAPAASGQGAPTPPPPAPVITHRTVNHAPSGAADTRTHVGVGERVRFSSTAAGHWSADHVLGGHPRTGNGQHYEWYAPATAATAKISFDPGGGAAKIDTTIHVVKPTVEYRNPRAVSFPGQAPGISGVAMETDVFYAPSTVSFARTWWWEHPGPATGATGYFVGKTLPYHHPTANDLPINSHNSGIFDTAGFWNFPSPYSAGFFEWVIPTHYKVTGESGRHLITNVHQTCRMAANGTMTVTKGGSASISRAP
jgi:hypothetical protein